MDVLNCYPVLHMVLDIFFIVSVTRRRIDIKNVEKLPLKIVGRRLEKFIMVSNDHGHTQKCNFPVLDREYPFWVNLIQKMKIVSLS